MIIILIIINNIEMSNLSEYAFGAINCDQDRKMEETYKLFSKWRAFSQAWEKDIPSPDLDRLYRSLPLKYPNSAFVDALQPQ